MTARVNKLGCFSILSVSFRGLQPGGLRWAEANDFFLFPTLVGTSKLGASNWGPHACLAIEREKRCWIWSGLLRAKEKQDQNEVVPRENLDVTNDIWGKVGKIRLCGVERSRGNSHQYPQDWKTPAWVTKSPRQETAILSLVRECGTVCFSWDEWVAEPGR